MPDGAAAPPRGRGEAKAGQHMKSMQTNVMDEMIGLSQPILELKDDIARIARYDAKVLITGESGVGKELVAASIHRSSARASRHMAAVNCAGLSETLLESELFGHVKGAFTGAYRDKPGKLEAADKGTIFLDELGEMTLRMQGMLLRFIETGELQKVGTDQATTRVNVRVIAATNRDLRQMIKQGVFREDLFYRLNVIHVAVPPLRERQEDIPLLIDHFLWHFVRQHGCVMPRITPEAAKLLVNHAWPGNVRELRNVLERLVVSGREVVRPEDLPRELRLSGSPAPPRIRERRRAVVDELWKHLMEERASFWTAVYPLFLHRDITRHDVRRLVRRGLEETCGNYKLVARMFNIDEDDYRRFLHFLRKHDCQIPFQQYRRYGDGRYPSMGSDESGNLPADAPAPPNNV